MMCCEAVWAGPVVDPTAGEVPLAWSECRVLSYSRGLWTRALGGSYNAQG